MFPRERSFIIRSGIRSRLRRPSELRYPPHRSQLRRSRVEIDREIDEEEADGNTKIKLLTVAVHSEDVHTGTRVRARARLVSIVGARDRSIGATTGRYAGRNAR